MSHFALIVAIPPADRDRAEIKLAEMLQPFHEFECTGKDDQYVQDLDITDEARAAYEKSTDRRFVSPEGEAFSAYSDQFYRDPTEEETAKIGPIAGTGGGNGLSWSSKDWGDGKGYRTKVHFLPEGWTDAKVPTSAHETFAQYVEGWYDYKGLAPGQSPDLSSDDGHKYGYYRLDEAGEVSQVIDRTNPNKKWDYWRIGGRYNGRFDGKDRQVVTKGWLDARIARAQAEAGGVYDAVQKLLDGETFTPWSQIPDGENKRDLYHEQAGLKKLRASGLINIWDDADEFLEPREKYCAKEAFRNVGAFAVLTTEGWFEKGKMGWFASVANEDSDWPTKGLKMLQELPEGTTVFCVDCHI